MQQRKPFKFRHVNRIAAAFIFLSVAMLAILATLAAKTQQWFSPVTEYRVELPGGLEEETASSAGEAGVEGNSTETDPGKNKDPGGTLGIKSGSDVRVIGNQVGYVKRVELCLGEELKPIRSFRNVDPNDVRIVAVLSVKGDFGHFVGKDSRAVLKYDLGGLGSAYFDISRGTRSFSEEDFERAEGSPVLAFEKEPDAKAEVFEIAARVEKSVLPAVANIDKAAKAATSTANNATELIEKFKSDDEKLMVALGELEKGLTQLNGVIEQAASKDSALGDMIYPDTAFRKEFSEFAVTLNTGTSDLKDAIKNLNDGISELRNVGVASVNEATKDLPKAVNKTNATIDEINTATKMLQEAIREIEILTEGLQKHWLVKRNIEDPIEDPKEKPSRTSGGRPPSNKGNATNRIFKRR
ncbi:MAG: hypothetical protein HKN23_02570 [Verrucomicrobiales bacterium]|nr:hypothetical protein [Verrucomicrobiales bacterium]